MDPLPPPPSTQARPSTTAPPDYTGVALHAVTAGSTTSTTVAMGPGTATVKGTVVGPDGTPAAGVTVRVERLVGKGVASVDVVVTKPGYGIVSEAISARTRMVYTERGDFPEYPILVQGMSRWLPAVHVTNEDLRAGELRGAIERVLALPFPDPPDLGGAKVAAQRLLALAR